MLIVDYKSKSYYRFLNDIPQISNHKTRFLITFNGASDEELVAASADLTSYSEEEAQRSTVITDKASEDKVTALFDSARGNREMLIFESADVLFDKKTAVKNSHERDNGFNLNHLFKSIAKHNGIIVLATDRKQILSASMSTKMDVVIRF